MLLARVLTHLIQDGALTLIDADGRTHRFGRASRPPDVVVRLGDRRLHHRLLASPSLALGEAYVDGTLTVERGDVYDLAALLARNLPRFASHPAARIARALALAAERRAPPGDERGPDLPDLLCDELLGWDRQCSCAYFSDPRMTLEEAQQAKKHHLASKLLLRPGHKVLEIGCGWGGLSLHLAEAEHVEVTGLSRSRAQVAVARRRAAEAELSGRVGFHLRSFADERGKYDRVVSVGLLEHLGPDRYDALFAKIRDLLHEDGVAVIHALGRASGPAPTNAWLRRHLAPGAHPPALSEVVPAIERAGLWITDVEVLRLHAAETLRHWRRRLVTSWDRIAARHDQRFCRTWELALALAEAGFRQGALVVFELQLGRHAEAAPLTRDYLYEPAPGSLDAAPVEAEPEGPEEPEPGGPEGGYELVA